MAIMVTERDENSNESLRKYYSFWPAEDANQGQTVEGVWHRIVRQDVDLEGRDPKYTRIQGLDEDTLVEMMESFVNSSPKFGVGENVCTDVSRKALISGGLSGLATVSKVDDLRALASNAWAGFSEQRSLALRKLKENSPRSVCNTHADIIKATGLDQNRNLKVSEDAPMLTVKKVEKPGYSPAELQKRREYWHPRGIHTYCEHD